MFIDRALELAQHYDDSTNAAMTTPKHLSNEYLNRKLIKPDGQVTKSRRQGGIELGADWHDWVQTNIMSSYLTTGVRVSYGDEGVTTHGPHCDGWVKDKPTYKLYCLLAAGGENTKTYFYKEKGQPAERHCPLGENKVFVDDYSKVDIIDEVQFPMYQWALFNTNILHGVENITGPRINLAVIFDTDYLDLKFERTVK